VDGYKYHVIFVRVSVIHQTFYVICGSSLLVHLIGDKIRLVDRYLVLGTGGLDDRWDITISFCGKAINTPTTLALFHC
jgi:hypothetical protein